jgi:ribonuclease-3
MNQGMDTLYIPSESNERLEFLGDNILKGVMARYLYKNFPKHREGFMSTIKIKIEKSESLSRIAKRLGFGNYLLLSEELESQTILSADSGRNKSSYYEDAFEAFIGAISEDTTDSEKGLVYAYRFATRILENEVDFVECITRNDNFKGSLQRFFQKQKWLVPDYITLGEDTSMYEKMFIVGIFASIKQLNECGYTLELESAEDYTKIQLKKYKNISKSIYMCIYNNYINSNMVLLSIGRGSKMIKAEQECAKGGLERFNLDPYTVEFK